MSARHRRLPARAGRHAVEQVRGLVERRPADHDRRVKLLALTEDGRALRASIGDRLHAPPQELAGLSAADQRALRDILARAFED
jgi:DNA-binding MarR family transcriptional regulator